MDGVKRTVACLDISSIKLSSLAYMALRKQIIFAFSRPVIVLDSLKRSLWKLFL